MKFELKDTVLSERDQKTINDMCSWFYDKGMYDALWHAANLIREDKEDLEGTAVGKLRSIELLEIYQDYIAERSDLYD